MQDHPGSTPPDAATIGREKDDLLSRLIDTSIGRVRTKRNYNKFRASLLHASTVVGSALVTIFLGLRLETAALDLKQAAFVLGAVITVLNAFEPYFNFRSLWIEHDEALADLYQLREDLDFLTAGSAADAEDFTAALDELKERHAAIWSRLSRKWLQFRRRAAGETVPRTS